MFFGLFRFYVTVIYIHEMGGAVCLAGPEDAKPLVLYDRDQLGAPNQYCGLLQHAAFEAVELSEACADHAADSAATHDEDPPAHPRAFKD